jgi:hypothetical protein
MNAKRRRNWAIYFGTDWPEIGREKVISFPNLSQVQEELSGSNQEDIVNQ